MADPLIPDPDVLRRAARVRLLVLDVDGVLTDGTLTYDDQGKESKRFHVRDGYGIKAVQAAGIDVAVISGRLSGAAQIRLAELGVTHVVLGCDAKRAALDEICTALAVAPDQIACAGDDLPDLGMLEAAGLAVAVADAHPGLDQITHWRTSLPGGHGAVREICDLLLAARESQ